MSWLWDDAETPPADEASGGLLDGFIDTLEEMFWGEALPDLGDVSNPVIGCEPPPETIPDEYVPINYVPNQLVAVEILDGVGDPVLGGIGVQWVNLEAQRSRFDRIALPPWLARGIDGWLVSSFDRLGRTVRVRLRFLRAGVERYVVRIKPTGQNVSYSERERQQASYRVRPQAADGSPDWLDGWTDADGRAVVEVQLRAAGGEGWMFEGFDELGNHIESTGALFTQRGLWLAYTGMVGVDLPALNVTRAIFAEQQIRFDAVPLARTPHRPFLDTSTEARFDFEVARLRGEVSAVYQAQELAGAPLSSAQPHVVTCAFYDQSPRPRVMELVRVAWRDQNYEIDVHVRGANRPLWTDINPADGWFVSGAVWIQPLAGIQAPWPHVLSAADFELIGSPSTGYRRMRLRAAELDLPTDAQLTVSCLVRIEAGGVNGFSSGTQGGESLIAQCTRSNYEARTADALDQTIIHEIGHKLSLTIPPGDATANSPAGQFLDVSPKHYSRDGDHCFEGLPAPLPPDDWSDSGTCVMFGGNGARRVARFCAADAERVRKINLEMGWTGP